MEWVDSLLINALPALVILSVLVALHPTLRGRRPWRAIGTAWLVTFIAALVVALTHLNEWSLGCQPVLLPGGNGTGAGTPGWFVSAAHHPCQASNSLPIWMTALPALIGIALLIVWALRSVSPTDAALRTIGLLIALMVGIVLIAQLSPNAALLAFLAVAVATYAWPRLREHAPA